jgi:hypothetical protein
MAELSKMPKALPQNEFILSRSHSALFLLLCPIYNPTGGVRVLEEA